MRTERDIKNQMAFAKAKGEAEGEARGVAIGEARGEAKGVAKTKKETASNLLKMGMEPESISQATGLTVEDILALKS